jgi:hypothetical protein
MAYEPSPLVNVRDNLVRVKHPNIEYNPRTYLGASVAAAGTTLTVRDNAGFLSGFTNNERVVLGAYGDERTEIKRITSDPSAGTTLAVAAVTFAHPIDTPVTQILWDQVEIHGNSTNSTSGTTTIATISLTPDEDFTQYTVTGSTYAFYFARYKNSTSSTTSSFSDGVASTGYAQNTRALIKQRALARSGVTLGFPLADGETISDEFLNAEIAACETDIEQRSQKWAFLLTDNISSPTSLVQGQRRYTVPTTILDDNSNRSIVSARISWNKPLIYLYPVEFNAKTANVVYTTVATSFTGADVTITLTDSGDFDDSGDILIGTDTISYTSNNRSTNVLSGVTGISSSHTAGDEVYQGAASGLPIYYTIKDGYFYLHPIPDSNYHQRNLNIEFYRTVTSMTTDGATTPVPFYNVFDIWLLWKIAERRKLHDESLKWEAEYERRILQALSIHIKAEEQKFFPAMADPQQLDYDRGRIISSVLN